MSQHDVTLAVFTSHVEAETCIKSLQHAGYDMTNLSIIGRDYQADDHVIGFYNAGDRVRLWGKTGVFWGGMWGLLVGSAFFMIPGVGPLLFAGPIIGSLVGALEGAAIGGGLSALGACLYGWGVPQNTVLHYESALKAGRFIVSAHGSAEEVKLAHAIMAASHALSQHRVHAVPQEAAVGGR